MDNERLHTLEPLQYSELKEHQVQRLRELEKRFNEEFGTECYFMVMEKDKL